MYKVDVGCAIARAILLCVGACGFSLRGAFVLQNESSFCGARTLGGAEGKQRGRGEEWGALQNAVF